MNMKKILLVSLLLLSMLLGLCACGGGDETQTTDPAATTAPTADSGETTAPNETEPDETEPDETEPSNEPTYTVKVVDEANNPIAGAMVQLCMEACVPAVTNEEGVAEFFLEENDYKVSFVMMPAGYELTGEQTQFYFEDGSHEMTIVLKAVA